ncbi:MAG: T9SS type A sorting domain-containing protein, partial [Ignavibacteria bacterium]|nr:T9SS type A sorting domain-containing protein [Ignavibacteria bacterium]
GNLFLITFVRTTVGITTISNSVPDKFSLENNYPNPFNPSTNIKFNIANVSLASLKIYDLKGREVAVLVNEKLQPGSYEFKYIADNLPSGVYFYRLETSSQSGSGDFTQTKRMILLK